MMQQTPYFLVVEYMVDSVRSSFEIIRREARWQTAELVLCTDDEAQIARFAADPGVWVVRCNFDDPAELAAAIEPFRLSIVSVICRGDGHTQQLRALVPHLPDHVRVASSTSLAAATDKRAMRQAFARHAPEITPAHISVEDAEPQTIADIEAHIGYPAIIKPANLASSLLIQSCETRDELRQGLIATFAQVRELYARERRRQEPHVIVEAFLSGDFYSIDAYVMDDARAMGFCPPVAYLPAKSLGIDDFFLYKRWTPVDLAPDEIARANETVRAAVRALGLTHTTVHAELVCTRDGWKMIEIGPRPGRFRQKMYRLAYGLDHSLNDMRIHVGLPPIIPTEPRSFAAAYSIYPTSEGRLRAIHGLDDLRAMPELRWLAVSAAPGAPAVFAKHGGHALSEFVIAADTAEAFAKACAVIEQKVYADIDVKP